MNRIVGDNIRKYRTQSGLSQESVADSLQMTQSNFAKYEKGEAKLRLDQAVVIATQFGVTVEDLMTDTTNMVRENRASYRPLARTRTSIILELDGTLKSEEMAINMVRQINKTLKEMG